MPVWNFGQPLDGIVQIAYTTADIRRDMDRFTRQLGIGPWFLFERFAFDWCRVRGEDTPLELNVALGFNGHMMFELIEQSCGHPSPYRETIERRGHGFHHWGRVCPEDRYDDLCAQYVADGFALALEAEVAVGGRAAYFDTEDTLGGMIELIEVTDRVEDFFARLHHASRLWDGADPIRRLTPPE